MWIHLNRVRSTLSKSVADTSGRFLSHDRKDRRRGMVRAGRARFLIGYWGPYAWYCLQHGEKLDLQHGFLRFSSRIGPVPG